jgi:hypothetical protein
VKVPVPEKQKWSCAGLKGMLHEELQNVLRQIDELKATNKELEQKLQLAGGGKRDTVAKQKDAK